MLKFKNRREQAIVRLFQENENLFDYDDDFNPSNQDLYDILLGDHYIYKKDLESDISMEIGDIITEFQMNHLKLG